VPDPQTVQWQSTDDHAGPSVAGPSQWQSTDDHITTKTPSLDWSRVIQNLPGSLKNLVTSTAPGPNSDSLPPVPGFPARKDFQSDADYEAAFQKALETKTPLTGRFSNAHPDFASRFPMLASGFDSVEELAHNITHPREFFEKDPVGAANTYGNIMAGGLKGLAKAAPETADSAVAATKGAGKGAVDSLKKLNYKTDIMLPGFAGQAVGVGYHGGIGLALGGKMVTGAVRGALDALAARHAELAEATAARDAAAAKAADAIRANIPKAESAPAATAEQPPVPLPESRQLPAPSGKPPIIAGPITPQGITGQDVTASNRPIDEAAPATPPASPDAAPRDGEIISKDELAQSADVTAKPRTKYAELSEEDKARVDSVYRGLHDRPLSPAAALPTTPESTRVEWQTPAEKAAAAAKSGAQANSPTAEVSKAADANPAPAKETPAEEPHSFSSTQVQLPPSAPTSRVVNLPGDASKAFAPAKIMSEEGLTQYARENGLGEDEARQNLEGDGYQIVGRSYINRALHGIGSELGLDHEALSDVAKMQYRVKSMTQLSQENMLELYQNLLDKRSISEPLRGKLEMAEEAQKSKTQQWTPPAVASPGDTPRQAGVVEPSVSPAPPSSLPESAAAGSSRSAQKEAAGANTDVPSALKNNPKALAAAQALKDALEKPEDLKNAAALETTEAPATPVKSWPLINVGDVVQIKSGRFVKVKGLRPDGSIIY